MSNQHPNPTQSAKASEQQSFSIVRVLKMVFALAAIAAAGYGGWSFLHTPPVLVPFTGRVTFNGNPVTIGGIATMRLDDQLDSATAPLDADGKFSLATNGEPGAYTGRHKVVISSMLPTMPPKPLIPGVYSSMATTPLRIEVSHDPAKNVLEINLEGELPDAEPAPATPDSGDQKTAEPAKESETTPAKAEESEKAPAEATESEPAPAKAE